MFLLTLRPKNALLKLISSIIHISSPVVRGGVIISIIPTRIALIHFVYNSFINISLHILNETSQPPLNIFSNILTYMIHKWLQFTLNMEKSIKLNLSKFHFHKLKLTFSFDRLYKGTIAFHFHTNAKI